MISRPCKQPCDYVLSVKESELNDNSKDTYIARRRGLVGRVGGASVGATVVDTNTLRQPTVVATGLLVLFLNLQVNKWHGMSSSYHLSEKHITKGGGSKHRALLGAFDWPQRREKVECNNYFISRSMGHCADDAKFAKDYKKQPVECANIYHF